MTVEVVLPLEIERHILELCANTSGKAQQLVLMLIARKAYDWICPLFYGALEIELSLNNWRTSWDRYDILSRTTADAPVRRLFTEHLRFLKFDVSWPAGFVAYDTDARAAALMEVFASSRPIHLSLEFTAGIADSYWGSIQKNAFSFPLTHLDLGYYASMVLCYSDMIEQLGHCTVVDTVTHLSVYAGLDQPDDMINNLPVFRALTHVALYAISELDPPIDSIRTLPKFLATKRVVLVEPAHKPSGSGSWNTDEWLAFDSHPNVAVLVEEYGLRTLYFERIVHDVSIWDRAEEQLKMRRETR